MKASKQYLRFCGIDMAKHKHVACIIAKINITWSPLPLSPINCAISFGES